MVVPECRLCFQCVFTPLRVLPACMSTDFMQHSHGAALQVRFGAAIRRMRRAAGLASFKSQVRWRRGREQPGEFSAAAPQPFGHVACCTTGFAKACQREARGLRARLAASACGAHYALSARALWLRCSVRSCRIS